MNLPSAPRDAVTELVLGSSGVAAVFPPRVADAVAGALGSVAPLVAGRAASESVQVRIAADASAGAADTGREVADLLLARFPDADLIRVQVDRIQ
ncbi:hypothetical protein [Microbacterium sp. SORGH_AS_0862]|uniref:hypothetical protein n=1 Tax=Microbacterium sp. SORGH_AS_0862 TaxID=3041789 RepID=UPI0027927A50|nr:hypothetical protein [Microbacterium sp. SORGH_AS_0862]MDQ1205549.1 hypothetical protein [Microbacterium sp. SORGH_AS_0862]